MILKTELTGSEALVLGFERSLKGLESGAERILRRAAGDLESLTSQLAPRGETGFLKRSVRTVFRTDGSGFETGWFWQDFGSAGLGPYYWFVEFGTKDMEAQPSLGPAWEETFPGLLRDLEALMAREFS